MRSKLTALALAGTLGATAFGGAALLSPAVASAATGTATAVSGRVAKITTDLSGLVSNGTLTQAQADKVASTLDSKLPRFGGHGPRRELFRVDKAAAAKALGLTEKQLGEQLRSGKSLAQIATAQGVSRDTLVNALVDATKAQLAADVKAGKITQAQADRVSAKLSARVAARVDHVRGARGDCGPGGMRGPGGRRGPGEPGTTGSPSPAPSAGTDSPTVSTSSYAT